MLTFSRVLRHEYKHSNSSKRISFFQKLSIAKGINLKVLSILIKVLRLTTFHLILSALVYDGDKGENVSQKEKKDPQK